MNNDLILQKEDYSEPCCVLKKPSEVTPIPVGRIIEKLDLHLSRNDYPSAERHLKYWLNEAQIGNDKRGELSVANELIGLYRKTEKQSEAFDICEKALKLLSENGLENSVTAATTYINIATAYKSFGKANEALPFYKKAEEVYEKNLKEDDGRLGGLYNNLGLALVDTGDFKSAEIYYFKAIDVMSRVPCGDGEVAITYCNLCDLIAETKGTVDGEKQIAEYLEKAYSLLNSPRLNHDGNYAYICEKCAPTFGYYGFFLYEIELNKRAREIYERA